MSPQLIEEALFDLAAGIASLLFASGASHSEWRWWAAEAARRLLDSGQPDAAAGWAAVAHDRSTLALLPRAPRPDSPLPRPTVWWLAAPEPSRAVQPAKVPADEVDAAWTTLAQSVPEKAHEATGSSLLTIVEFWAVEVPDWQDFHPHDYPDFQIDVNAVAALAHASGWRPVRWPSDALRFVEAGLAPGDLA